MGVGTVGYRILFLAGVIKGHHSRYHQTITVLFLEESNILFLPLLFLFPHVAHFHNQPFLLANDIKLLFCLNFIRPGSSSEHVIVHLFQC